MLSVDPAVKTFSYRGAGCLIGDWSPVLEADGSKRTAATFSIVGARPLDVDLSFPDGGLAWEIREEPRAAPGTTILTSTIVNRGDRPVRLGKARLLSTSTGARIGNDPTDLVCLSLSGEVTERPIMRLSDPECPRDSKVKTQFYQRRERVALQVGFLTFRRADTVVRHAFDPVRGVTSLEAWCDFAGWVLGPGECTSTEVFVMAAGSDPCAQLVHWAELAALRCAPRRWEEAPIGWVGWSWVDGFTVERYEDVVERNARAIGRRLAGYGLRYVWISLGNIADSTPGRWLDWNRRLFPRGPAYLSRMLQERGLKWGLWCGIFWMCPLATEQAKEMEDALLRNPDGSPLVVRQEWQYGKAGGMRKADRPPMYALDPSHPRTHAFLRKTFETYRSWGVSYYMIDFLQAGAGSVSSHPYQRHHDGTLVAGPEAYHSALRVVRAAAGDDTHLLSSCGPTVHNAGIVDAVRTGNDFGEGRALYPDSYFYPATFVINSGAFWTGPRAALQNQAAAWYTHRRLYINNSGNVLSVDKPIPLSDAQTFVTIHALSGGPTMIGDDIDRMDEERLGLIKKTLPRPRDVAVPVRLFDRVHPDYPKVFHRRIVRDWGGWDVVAVYNLGEGILEETVRFEDIGLPSGARCMVWEFWNCEYVGRREGQFIALVPPRSVRVFRLVEDTGAPALLGTDMHILMGEVEVTRCAWDAATSTLSGSAIRPAGERGSVYLHAPEGLAVANPEGLWIAKDARDRTLVIRVSLDFTDGPADWAVRFAPHGFRARESGVDFT